MPSYSWSDTALSYKDTRLTNEEDEEIIKVESDLRTIIVPESLKVIGVAGDHRAESIFFQIPRYFDGQDLSEHNCLIRYINAGNEYGEYPIADKAVDEKYIILGWQITNLVTRYAGTINFTIQFETIDYNGVEYQWQTIPATLTVLPGLNVEKTITEKDDSLFRNLSSRVQYIEERLNKLSDYESKKIEIDDIQNRLKYLEDNVVYTLSNV